MTQSRIASLMASLSVRLPEKYGFDGGAEEFHSVDVGCLSMDVFLAHVDDAFESHHGAGRGCSDSVLSGSGFGDDAVLAKTLCQVGSVPWRCLSCGRRCGQGLRA